MSERQATPCRAVTVWLLFMACAVAAMVSIGGVTRLTGSGLSMVEWRPLIGWLPPLSEAEWQRIFALYRETPEFRQVNFAIDLDGFRAIFWWEYVHRLWGRLLGVFFAVPLVWFWLKGRIDRPLRPRLALLLALGALQGLVGWWMVRSGLADRPDVSAARLAVHLGLALLIFALLVWTALDRIRPQAGARAQSAWLLLGLIAAAIASGALVAGTDGGLIYNSFPLMGGELVPPDYRSDRSWVADALENPVAAQLHHRLLALAALLAVAAAWLRAGGRQAGTAEHILLAAVLLQAGLGLAALLAVVPPGLAALHQFGAVLLLAAALLRTHGAIVPASIEFGNTDNRSTIQ